MAAQTKNNKRFKLEKWYLDGVTEEGNSFIVYASELKWHKWRITYSSILTLDQLVGISHKFKIGNCHFPEKSKALIKWQDDYFKFDGVWNGNNQSIQERLFENSEGSLDWKCYQPSSKVSFRFKNKNHKALGYAEKLVLTAVPWDIPMDELRWGRFVSSEYNIVWIEYKRDQIKQWAWVNGEKVENWDITDDYVANDKMQLKLIFGEKVVLEKEKKIFNVVKTLVKFLPGFKRSVPLKFLNSDEKKWLNKSSLMIDNQRVSTGWSIHELVDFSGN